MSRTLEDITPRQKDLCIIPQRRAAEEEKKLLERRKISESRPRVRGHPRPPQNNKRQQRRKRRLANKPG